MARKKRSLSYFQLLRLAKLLKKMKYKIRKKKSRVLRFLLKKLFVTRKFSFYRRKRLLNQYQQKIYVRCQSNNVFLNICLSRNPLLGTTAMLKSSAGMLPDYTGRKKRKKTYMLGFELAYLNGEKLREYKIRGLQFILTGHGAQKKGIMAAYLRQNFLMTKFRDQTPLAHNGTRACGVRRL